MSGELDRLTDEAYVETAPVVHDRPAVDCYRAKPVQPEPGEPALLGSTAPIAANGLQRRLEQRRQAQERRLVFARALVSTGWDNEKALAAAGYNPAPKLVSRAITALLNHPDVIGEVQRLRAIIEQKADVATIDLAKEWIGVAKSNIFDYFDEVESDDGVVALALKPRRQITREAQKAVKAIKIRRRKQVLKDGTEIENEDIEVQLWDKQAALDSLAKIQGLYADKTADAIDNLALKIAQRTENYRKKVGQTFDSKALEGPG